jgi:hypothetical protein
MAVPYSWARCLCCRAPKARWHSTLWILGFPTLKVERLALAVTSESLSTTSPDRDHDSAIAHGTQQHHTGFQYSPYRSPCLPFDAYSVFIRLHVACGNMSHTMFDRSLTGYSPLIGRVCSYYLVSNKRRSPAACLGVAIYNLTSPNPISHCGFAPYVQGSRSRGFVQAMAKRLS